MLTFEQKLDILDTYPQLQRNHVSLGRVNYLFEESLHEKKTVAYHLHPNGNGFIYAGLLSGYETDSKGFVNIREYGEHELRSLIDASIDSLSTATANPEAEAPSPRKKKRAAQTDWVDSEGHTLTLKLEEGLWYLYAGLNLEMAFETLEEAQEYLAEEGFTPAKG